MDCLSHREDSGDRCMKRGPTSRVVSRAGPSSWTRSRLFITCTLRQRPRCCLRRAFRPRRLRVGRPTCRARSSSAVSPSLVPSSRSGRATSDASSRPRRAPSARFVCRDPSDSTSASDCSIREGPRSTPVFRSGRLDSKPAKGRNGLHQWRGGPCGQPGIREVCARRP
jgi:hypothetical protein